ncbi:MAG TPA: hypothetical protein VFS21_21415 [Roseiflexaceae bacterium]|nr:hypothetical protein [Roseiflexaceae bacterium]
MGTYQTNEIVIIDTTDAIYGHIRMPAIIRFEYTDRPGYYEVNAVIPCGMGAADPHDLVRWTLREDEIAQSLGMAVVEHDNQPRVAGRWVFIPDAQPGTIEQAHRHRIVGA